MKLLISTILVIGLFQINAQCQASVDLMCFTEIDLQKGVYTDSEAKLLFIDFADYESSIQAINLFTNQEEVLADDVRDLGSGEIYEISFSKFRNGVYRIEIVLVAGRTLNYLINLTDEYLTFTLDLNGYAKS